MGSLWVSVALQMAAVNSKFGKKQLRILRLIVLRAISLRMTG
jgi:hypothetical protein